MIGDPPWLAAGGKIGHAVCDCQSRMCGLAERAEDRSTQLDHESRNNPGQRQYPDDDPGDLHPVTGAFGLRRCAFDPLVPRPLGLGSGTMVVPEVPAELGVRFRWMGGFHGKIYGEGNVREPSR